MEELSSYQVLKVGGASKVKEKRVPTGIEEFEITPKGVVLKKFVGMEHVLEGKPRKSMQEKTSADRSKS